MWFWKAAMLGRSFFSHAVILVLFAYPTLMPFITVHVR